MPEGWKEVTENMNHHGILKQGGGYVFKNIHNIQAGVPPENIVAMYDAAYEAGFYESHEQWGPRL